MFTRKNVVVVVAIGSFFCAMNFLLAEEDWENCFMDNCYVRKDRPCSECIGVEGSTDKTCEETACIKDKQGNPVCPVGISVIPRDDDVPTPCPCDEGFGSDDYQVMKDAQGNTVTRDCADVTQCLSTFGCSGGEYGGWFCHTDNQVPASVWTCTVYSIANGNACQCDGT
jgi:hypothetical protein